MATADEIFAAAERHLAAGRVDAAASLFQRLLAEDGSAVPGHRGLGLVALKRGDAKTALAHFQAARSVGGETVALYCDLGTAYRLNDQPAAAETCYRRALVLEPGSVLAENNLAALLCDLGRTDEARRRLQDILDRLEQAPADDPSQARRSGVVYNLAIVCLQTDDEAAAEDLLRTALALDDESWEAPYNLGVLLTRQGHLEEAAEALDQALLRSPGSPVVLGALARLHTRAGRFEAADTCLAEAMTLDPGALSLRSALAELRLAQGRDSEAVAAYAAAIRQQPSLPLPYVLLAEVMVRQGQLEAALATVGRALQHQPAFTPALTVRADLLLRTGRFEAGFDALARIGAPQDETVGNRGALPEDLVEVALCCALEGEPPDVIDALRHAGELRARGAGVTVLIRPELAPLARCLRFPPSVTTNLVAPQSPAERVIRAASLPHLLGSDAKTLAASVPYLQANPDLAARWRRELSALPRPWIGVAVVEPALAALLEPALQPGGGSRLPLRSLLARLSGWDALVALLSVLDLTVGDDETAMSLAGALGRPGWLLLPRPAHWRWLQDGPSTPFYPTLRLLRQDDAASPWTAAVTAVAELAATGPGALEATDGLR